MIDESKLIEIIYLQESDKPIVTLSPDSFFLFNSGSLRMLEKENNAQEFVRVSLNPLKEIIYFYFSPSKTDDTFNRSSYGPVRKRIRFMNRSVLAGAFDNYTGKYLLQHADPQHLVEHQYYINLNNPII